LKAPLASPTFTGTATMDGLTVDGDASISATNARLRLFETDTTDLNTQFQNQAGDFFIKTIPDDASSSTTRFSIDHSTGDISFYEDTGTTAKLFWDASAERLGIGTTSPSTALDISATTGAIKTTSSTGTNIAYNAILNTGGGLYLGLEQSTGGGLFPGSSGYDAILGHTGAYKMHFATSNTIRATIDSSGNVGIGGTPDTQLNIKNADDAVVRIESTGSESSDDARLEIKTTNGTFTIQNDRSLGTSGALTFAGNTSNNLVIDHNSGNVGINQVNPGAALDIKGDTSTYAGMAKIYLTDSNSNSESRNWSIGNGGSGFGNFTIGLSNAKDGDPQAAGTHTNPFVIDNTGKVGIGENDPQTKLHVYGTDPVIRVSDDGTSGFATLELRQQNTTTEGFEISYNSGTGHTHLNNVYSAGDMVFATNTGSFGTTSTNTRMRIDSAGRVLINQTSSNLTYGKLQVSAGGETAGFGGIVGFFDTDVSVASSNLIMKVQFSGDTDATDGVFIRFSDSNSTLGQITAANGTQCSYGVSSDERLKENIVDASSQLDLINNIRVREFDWKVNGYHEVGMIAQELNTVVPSVVQEGGDDITEQPWTVDYGKLTPYLIKAIQEQQTIIDDLKSRIETLEG
jgi:hypothetical protein